MSIVSFDSSVIRLYASSLHTILLFIANPRRTRFLGLCYFRTKIEHRTNNLLDAMNWPRKLKRLILTCLKLMIVLRVAGRLRGSWE